MTYKMMLFDNYSKDKLSTMEAFDYMLKLKNEGHPVKQRRITGRFNNTVLAEAWLEFDTEEDAALFKLTHL